MQALVFGAAKPLAGGGGGNLQFLNQDVEVLDDQLASSWGVFEKTGCGSAHFLQGHVGGRQGAGLLKHVPQAAGVHRQDAGVTCHQGIPHVAQEPGEVADGFFHPDSAVTANRNWAEPRGQYDAHIGITAGAIEQPGEDVAPGTAGALGKGLNRLLEGCLVGGKGYATGWGLRGAANRPIQIGQRGPTGKDAVGRLGNDEFGVVRKTTGSLNAQLSALKEGDQALEFSPIGEAILLLRLTDAGERQGVVALGSNPGAAAAGGHGH